MRPSLRATPWSWRAPAISLIVVVAAACGSSSSNGTSNSTAGPRGASSTTLPAVVKVGPNPSVSAKMVCGTEGQAVIAAALNETPTKITTPTWTDHVYACDYMYSSGSMSLAVKELTRKSETDAYYASLEKKYGVAGKFELGSGAFYSPSGVVVTRKDYKVLTVDPAKLPKQFGQPPANHRDIAIGTASALMGCWTGA